MLAYLGSAAYLHLLFTSLWEQMHDPRHSLHWLLMRLCLHMLDPPHSMHALGQICHSSGLSTFGHNIPLVQKPNG